MNSQYAMSSLAADIIACSLRRVGMRTAVQHLNDQDSPQPMDV